MQRLEVGQIVNTFGINGYVKVKPFTDDISRFNELKKIFIKDIQYNIEKVKYHKDMVLIKLTGIDKIEQAEQLRNTYIEIDRKDGIIEDGAYYIVDLIGLEVITDNGKKLGFLEDVYNTGSNDIYVVKKNMGKQILLPAIEDVIKDINIENKIITVHLLKGLDF